MPKSSEIMKEKTGTVVGIQYLRAFAAMSVVWFHALRASPEILQRLNDSYFAGTGVPLFFVISGFIMVMTTAKGMSPSKFMELRIIRVVPLYWLWTLFLVALTLIAPHMLKRCHPHPARRRGPRRIDVMAACLPCCGNDVQTGGPLPRIMIPASN